VRYVSTRGLAPDLGFSDAVLTGLARDGGLYWPDHFVSLSGSEIAGFSGRSYEEIARAVISPYATDIAAAELGAMIDQAYASFRHDVVCPLVQIGDNQFVLELFHGPTLAFKDVAMQLLGRLMDHILKARGQRATIVGATSGDTGGAAIEAFSGLEQVDVFILYPHGRVSEVQRRQMTTVNAANIHALAVEGTFDDCQAHVKAMFNHLTFRDHYALSGVNSINWARILAQTVYYFTAAAALGAPHRPVNFSVPTGNFGDILAGYVAKSMGLPIKQLMIATNSNDILARTMATGRYDVTGVMPTSSPSMDIQVSSNFERLLFEACGRDAERIRHMMAGLAQGGAFTIPDQALETIRHDFAALRADEEAVSACMRSVLDTTGYLLDPHTAVGVVASNAQLESDPATPSIVLATAHPAKFPDAVKQATGIHPALPPHLADLLTRQEHFTVVANDVTAIESFIAKHSRIDTERPSV
jgi:threonine synthase